MANNTNWLNISSQSGSSGQTILTLSANKNLSTNYKTAEITAYNPVYNISAKTYVTLESYAPFLSISPDLFGVPDSGGTYELTINANCAWVIAFPDLVTSYSTSAGTGNAVITFTVPGTTADTTLVGNIVVTDESGQISKIAKIEQYGSGVHIGVFPVELYFDSTGGSQTFSVSADAAYNVSVASGTNWAFVEPNSGYTGQTVFTVRVNSGYTGTTDRQGVINIDAPGQDLAVILYQRKPETRLVTVYNVTSTTDPTTILGDTSFFSKAELANGTEITLGTGYTFPSTGNQKVYYTLTGNTVGGFENSTALTQVVIPEGVTEIADSAFANCTNLTYIKITDTVTQVGVSAFSQCTSLSSITLPDSLERMESAVFSGCTSLSSITIPSAVTSIGSNCFSGSSVSSITFTSLTPPTLGDANALTSNTLSEIIVPCPAVNDYITAYPQYAQYISCSDTGTTLYFTTDTSNVKGLGETRTITILNTNINPNRTGLNLPSDFPQQGSYVVEGNVIYLTYPANPSSSATRNWTIGVVAQTKDGVSLSGSYTITQNANVIYAIPYTADTSAVDASGETRTITIDTSNLVASSITVGIEGATGVTYTYENGVITVSFPHNNTVSQRDITLNITGETVTGNEASASIAYAQEAGSPYEIPYTADTSTVAASGETRTITIDTSILVESSITLSVEGATGVTTTYQSGIITVVFPYNAETNDKNIMIGVTASTTNGSNATANINYIQRGDEIIYAIPYTADTSTVNKTGETRTITIDTSNLVASSIIVGIEGATGVTYTYENGVITVVFQPNHTTASRNLTVTVSGQTLNGNEAIASIEYMQEFGALYEIPYTADTSTVAASGETRTITIDTTDLITSSITIGIEGATGVTYTYDNGVITVTFPENFGGERDISVNIDAETIDGEKPKTKIIFSQSASPLGTPLTFVIISGGTIRWVTYNTGLTRTIEYKKNDGEWTSITSNPGSSLSVSAGDVVQFRGNNTTYGSSSSFNTFSGSTAKFELEGNIMSLIDSSNFATATTLTTSYTFYNLFRNCTGLTSAEKLVLPATTLANYCYEKMFFYCPNLTAVPELPATTLANYCYDEMFSDCKNLTTAPELPATVLTENCYSSMFSNCASLEAAPELPAMTLADSCYDSMFNGCTSLTQAPELSATTLKYGCYMSMFAACTSLTTAPLLPATTLANSCYVRMFNGCTSLTASTELPATTLADRCYLSMFKSCKNLKTAPVLLATTLANRCYFEMFSGCTSLTTAPELPATTLADYCYYGMFYGCTNLTAAPELPATKLVVDCYYKMFMKCSKLNYIKCLANNISALGCTDSWLYNVSSTGTFVTPSSTNWSTGIDGIPSGWTRVNSDT